MKECDCGELVEISPAEIIRRTIRMEGADDAERQRLMGLHETVIEQAILAEIRMRAGVPLGRLRRRRLQPEVQGDRCRFGDHDRLDVTGVQGVLSKTISRIHGTESDYDDTLPSPPCPVMRGQMESASARWGHPEVSFPRRGAKLAPSCSDVPVAALDRGLGGETSFLRP